MSTVLISAGDSSGDAIAADFVAALRTLRPDTRFLGMAGVELEKCGVERVADQRDLAVGGLVELAPGLPRVLRAWRQMTSALRRTCPDLVVLVDSSGFNLPLARRARRAGSSVLYYVSPQVWAWRAGRKRKLARRVDRMAVIFPFEPRAYAGSGLDAEYVGHPLLDRLAREAEARDRGACRRRLGLPDAATVVALLPGSRRNEVRRGTNDMLAAARLVHARDPRTRFVLPLAASIDRSLVAGLVRRAQSAGPLPVDLVAGCSLDVLAACDVALLKPGTATLEAALLDRPMVVTGRLHPLSAAIVRRLVKVDSLAMPNLIAGRRVVPELLQAEATPEALADALRLALEEPGRGRQRAGLAEVRRSLGGVGAARRTAEIAQEMLVARRRA
jgi:lipid-A-disaccharide synthase